MSLIYEPSDDSYLLSSVLNIEIPSLLRLNPQIKILEIGSGSGFQLEILKSLGVKNLLGTDINPKAIKLCNSAGFKCLNSDLFSNIMNDQKYDLIIFNPPYLPRSSEDLEGKESELITTGGEKGSEIINKFLKLSKKHLTKNGKIFLITSSLTKGIHWLNYKKKILKEKKLFFEKLFVWELTIS